MRYKIVYTKRAEKDISKLDWEAKVEIKKALERYAEDPLNYARKMIDIAFGTYRFRVGDYRIIFDIEGNELVILRVGHRRKIYRNL